MSNKVLIIESIGRPIEMDLSKTSVAHVRNAVILSKLVGADIVTCERDMYIAEGKQYDHIICSYASPYMKYKALAQILRDNEKAKLWWMVNDHDLEDNPLLRIIMKESGYTRKINMICNNARENYRGWILRKKMKDENKEFVCYLDDCIDEWHTINLNTLIFQYQLEYDWSKKTEEAIYYGTMRKHRLPDLLEYQHASNMTYSVSTRSQKKFIERGVDSVKMIDKLSWQVGNEELNKFKFSLYIEDEHTHEHYAHMANRYYEGLMTNTLVIFDSKCQKTIDKSHHLVNPNLVVSDHKEFEEACRMFSDRSEFEAQLKREEINIHGAHVEREEAEQQLKEILS